MTQLRARKKMRFCWRLLRVDTYQPGLLRKLFKSGLRLVDLGIDSASPDMLKLMNKSSCPREYLEMAILLMSEAHELGIFCKVNMLVHPGDTRESLNRSEKWLCENQSLISAISVSPALVFPGTDLDSNFNDYQKSFGTKKLNNCELSSYGVYEIDPSVEINNNLAKEYSLRLSRLINRKEKYAYAKSFGYHKVIETAEELILKLPNSQKNNNTPYSN